MRGKVLPDRGRVLGVGITPAYAGKSFLRSFSQSRSGDHPRVCGEKLIKGLVHPIWMGSPPRMRGKGIEQSNCRVGMRITPAYAGKRIICPKSAVISWDHPRVCGEKLRLPAVRFEGVGSPPHVRGKAAFGRECYYPYGITPACAGKRQALAKALSRSRDHPRMCGEKESARPARPAAWGSPPRMRGKVKSLGFRCLLNGITPAYAGKRLKRSRSTVSPVAIVPLFPSVCNKPVVSDGRARCSTFSAS